MPMVPYTALIPINIGWFVDEDDWRRKNGTEPPTHQGRRKLWNDLNFSWGGGFWQPQTGTRSYRILARNADGTFALAGLDDHRVAATYSQTCLNTYRAHPYAVPNGVPYLVTIEVESSEAQQYNFSSTGPVIDYPVELRSDWLLLPQSPTVVMALDYQEFNKLVRPPELTDEQRIELVVDIAKRPGMSAKNKVAAMRTALTNYGGQPVNPI